MRYGEFDRAPVRWGGVGLVGACGFMHLVVLVQCANSKGMWTKAQSHDFRQTGGPDPPKQANGSQLASRVDRINHILSHRLHCMWGGGGLPCACAGLEGGQREGGGGHCRVPQLWTPPPLLSVMQYS